MTHGNPTILPRLRQLVLAAGELEPVLGAVQDLLGADPPYRDPGVGSFGLANGVLSAGTSFVEVVSPVEQGTSAGRWLDRHGGDGGYMAMAQVTDGAGARARLAALGVRVVWDTVLPDAVDLHLHPKDVGGCLLALDEMRPEGSWRWAGPEWTGRAPARSGGLVELVVAVPEPEVTAERWRAVLGLPADHGPLLRLAGDTQQVRFLAAEDPAGQGVVAATLALPIAAPRSSQIAGVQLDLVPTKEDT